MIGLPWKSTPEISNGELPKSKLRGPRPRTSPVQIWPIPASRRPRASSPVRTITMLDAPFAKATAAAVVKARNTSMTATVPVARVAPSRRLWIEISIASASVYDILPRLFCGGRKFVHVLEEQSKAPDLLIGERLLP